MSCWFLQTADDIRYDSMNNNFREIFVAVPPFDDALSKILFWFSNWWDICYLSIILLTDYTAYSFFSYITSIHGRNLPMLITPLLALFLWGLGWQLIFVYADEEGEVQDTLASLEPLITPLLTPLAFLLTFRLGRAAVRFWGMCFPYYCHNISSLIISSLSPLK